jgi:DNA recombination protein RmuC
MLTFHSILLSIFNPMLFLASASASLLPWAIILILLCGCAVLCFLLLRSIYRKNDSADELMPLRQMVTELETRLAGREELLAERALELLSLQDKLLSANRDLAAKSQALEDSNKRIEEAATMGKANEEQLLIQFQNLSNKIVEVQADRFTKIQEKQVGDILNPLRERISEFQRTVTDLKDKGIEQQGELKSQLENLRLANKQIEDEARNLSQALRGQKTQGAWGELVLERVLEVSGLTEGREFRRQVSYTLKDGSRLQPDVVIDLPENKHIIIDAKVSLTAFQRWHEADTPEAGTKAMKDHQASLRTHIDGLTKKDYSGLETMISPEFVLMFIPIEPAYTSALKEDPSLFDYAFSKRIILVTPSTLLATLKTVASIWRLENQNRNALEIARLGGELHDKLANFCEDIEEVGKRLEQAKNAHENAVGKLSTGRGNALRTIERMRILGLTTKKQIPPNLLESALADEEA